MEGAIIAFFVCDIHLGNRYSQLVRNEHAYILAWLFLTLLDDVSSSSLMSVNDVPVVKRRTVGPPVISIASSSNLLTAGVEVVVVFVVVVSWWQCCKSNEDAARFNPTAEDDDVTEDCCCNRRDSMGGDGRRRSDPECFRQIDMKKKDTLVVVRVPVVLLVAVCQVRCGSREKGSCK